MGFVPSSHTKESKQASKSLSPSNYCNPYLIWLHVPAIIPSAGKYKTKVIPRSVENKVIKKWGSAEQHRFAASCHLCGIRSLWGPLGGLPPPPRLQALPFPRLALLRVPYTSTTLPAAECSEPCSSPEGRLPTAGRLEFGEGRSWVSPESGKVKFFRYQERWFLLLTREKGRVRFGELLLFTYYKPHTSKGWRNLWGEQVRRKTALLSPGTV